MEGMLRAMLGNYKGALSSIERALDFEKVEPKRKVELLWKARMLDLMEKREESSPIYAELSNEDAVPRPIARAAARGHRRAFREKELTRVLLDFTNGDTFE
jgi:phosphate starvation-inducible protein PhoH